MDEPRESLDIRGTIVRYEDVEGRKDLTAIAVHFEEKAVPMTYRMHINDYLSQMRQSRTEGGAEAPAEAAAASAKPAAPEAGA
jgi:hypothetical protein